MYVREKSYNLNKQKKYHTQKRKKYTFLDDKHQEVPKNLI